MTIAERVDALEQGQADTTQVLQEHGRALARIDRKLDSLDERIAKRLDSIESRLDAQGMTLKVIEKNTYKLLGIDLD